MLKTQVGYSIKENAYDMGVESITNSTKDFLDVKLNFLFTSENNDIRELVRGIKSKSTAPIIGCTSKDGIITQDGYITSNSGYAGIMSLNDSNMVIGVASHEAGNDARIIGRKVAIEAVENANTNRAPAYFYMVASPEDEEEYLMGIQDVIGRVPVFGGSAADDNLEGNWKIICNNKIISNGVAVAFIYTDNEIETRFVSDYNETQNVGLITEVKDNHTIVSIDNVAALKKYAHWINESPNDLLGKELLLKSITKPLGIKDSLRNMMIIRQPIFGDNSGTKKINDDTLRLGNKVAENTAIIQLETSIDELINSTANSMKELKKSLYTEPAGYLLFHSAARKTKIDNRIDEVYKNILKEAKEVPFIVAFTYGEYGYYEHSSNICSSLMLSFTVFGKK